jgi:hypothetical protein
MTTLLRLGWGGNNPAFRHMFSELFIPGATQEQMHYRNELQRSCTAPEIAARSTDAWGKIDIMVRTITLWQHKECAGAAA